MRKTHRFTRYLVAAMLSTAVMACASTSKHESTGQYVDDSVITSTVKAKFANDSAIKSFQISVETYKGVVQLSGFVDSHGIAARAEAIALDVDGVRDVKNSLIVK